MNWKDWCRLCGSYENICKIGQDIEKVLIDIFEIQIENSCICLDCDAYVRDFNIFLSKCRRVGEMFDELMDGSITNKEGIIFEEEFLLQTRIKYNLPLPENQFSDSLSSNKDLYLNSELVKDIDDIVQFKIEDSSDLYDKIEYVFESDEADIIQTIDKELTESGLEILDDEVEFMHEDEIKMEDEDPDSSEEADEISKHFDFCCHVCNTRFTKMHFLTTHMFTEHNTLPRVNCSCGRILSSVNAVTNHYETHINKTASFQCAFCKKYYKTESNYQNHLLTHQGDEDKEERKFKCDCGKSFKESRHLSAHWHSHLPDEKKFIHSCNYCQRRYSSIFSLRQHIKHVHEKILSFKCDDCDKMFSRKANLDSHVSHVHTAARNFQCDLCGLKVKTKGILRVHRKIHSTNADDLLPCDVCHRQFKTQNQLTNHKICHSNIRKYKCELCPAAYKRLKELTSHVASTHTGEIRYACSWCPKTFFNNSNFRKHKLKMHPDEIE